MTDKTSTLFAPGNFNLQMVAINLQYMYRVCDWYHWHHFPGYSIFLYTSCIYIFFSNLHMSKNMVAIKLYLLFLDKETCKNTVQLLVNTIKIQLSTAEELLDHCLLFSTTTKHKMTINEWTKLKMLTHCHAIFKHYFTLQSCL